jgi:uncharacterized protein (TIRG00374 family)
MSDGPIDPTAPPALAARWRRTLRFALGLALGGAAIWVVVNAAGGLGDALDALGRVDWWWLLPAALFEGLAYFLSGLRLRRLAGPAAVSPASATGIELVVNGLGLLTPASPAEGLAFGVSELSRRGLDRRHIALTLGFSQWFSLRVFLLVNALNLGWILATRDFPVDSTWPLIAAPLILAGLAVTAFLASRPATMERLAVLVGAARFWKPRLDREERRASGARFHADAMEVVGPPRRRIALMGLSVGSMLADIACLYFALIAAHAHVGFDIALLAAGAAAASALIPLLPGGLGVVEAIIPAVVHWYGPPVSAAFAGALVYRALGTFLPAAAGAIALVVLRARRPRATTVTDATSGAER